MERFTEPDFWRAYKGTSLFITQTDFTSLQATLKVTMNGVRSLFHQKMFMVLVFTCLSFVTVVESFGNNTSCEKPESAKLGCTPQTLPLKVVYTNGTMSCGDAIPIADAAVPPSVSVMDDQMIQADKYYTLLLVDTTTSPMHPILHYGAVNIPGSNLSASMDLAESTMIDVFSSYRGPNPPGYVPGIQTKQFNYEYILAEQGSGKDDSITNLTSNIRFNYTEFLSDRDTTTITTSYFSSGFCVTPKQKENPGKPTSASYAQSTSLHLMMMFILVLSVSVI